MSKNRNLKKGFSLVEALIALTLIALIFATATTAIVSTVNNRRYTEVKRFFINETQNYLECYKRGGKKEFKDNLYVMLGIKAKQEVEGTHNAYTVYYSKSFEVVPDEDDGFLPDGAFFKLVVNDSNNSFNITVYEAEDATKIIYQTETPFVSRFDMAQQGA